MWLSDDEHTNTMLSLERSDIGAGIAIMEDNTYVVVIETALQTKSGQQQSDAYAILTGIPQTQSAYSSIATWPLRMDYSHKILSLLPLIRHSPMAMCITM